MAIIPNNPLCKFTLDFTGITPSTMLKILKRQIEDDEGTIDGDIHGGNVITEDPLYESKLVMVYRIRSEQAGRGRIGNVDFFVTEKHSDLKCDAIETDMRKLMNDAIEEARADLGLEDLSEELMEVVNRGSSGSQSPSNMPQVPVKKGHSVASIRDDQVSGLEKLAEVESKSKFRRTLIIASVVGIVAVAGFVFLRRRANQEET